MAKITWDNRADSGSNSAISASIFNETKDSVNAVYDILEAQIGTTSTNPTANLVVSGNLFISGNILPAVASGETTSSFSLGSPTAAWKDLYVSTGSIKFVSSQGAITSLGASDVTKVKEGKFPVTSRTVGGITFDSWVQSDAIFSSATDNTRIDFGQSNRIALIAGGNTYVAINDTLDTIQIGAGAGPINTTTFLNDTTIVPSDASATLSGSFFVKGTRAQAPQPPLGLYTGVMNGLNNNGFGLVKKVNGENVYISAPTNIPVTDIAIPIAFTEGTPQSFTNPGPGRAEYDSGKAIDILADAPFNTGFRITASFDIPFSSSLANFQNVTVQLVELPNENDYYTDSVSQHPFAEQVFTLRPQEFSNGIVTGSFSGKFNLKSGGIFQPTTSSGNGIPLSVQSNKPIASYLDYQRPIQLRIKSTNIGLPYYEASEAFIVGEDPSLSHNGGSATFKDPNAPLLALPYFDNWWNQPIPFLGDTTRRLDGNNWWQLQYSDFPEDYSPSSYLYDSSSSSNTLNREYVLPVTLIEENFRFNLKDFSLAGFSDIKTYKTPVFGTFKFKNPVIDTYAWALGNFEGWTIDFDTGTGNWGNQQDASKTDTYTLKMKKLSSSGVISDVTDINGKACSGSVTFRRDEYIPLLPGYNELASNVYSSNTALMNAYGQRVIKNFPISAQYFTDLPDLATEFLEVDLNAGDEIFFTLTAKPYTNTSGGTLDKYGLMYLGVQSEEAPIAIYEATYDANSEVTIDASPATAIARFQLQNEVYPNQSPLECYSATPDLGISQAGATIANGGFLCVGPLSGAIDPSFGGQQGNFISCSADNVIAVGKNNVIGKDNSVTVGFGNESRDDNQLLAGFQNVATALGGIAFGHSNLAQGPYSLAQGYRSATNAPYSHAEGSGTTTNAQASHAEGFNTATYGQASHAEGGSSETYGNYSHAEGYATKANGQASHAEGIYSFASGQFSHAEGEGTITIGDASHAEGNHTITQANYSHAEGYYTTASGIASHAEGIYTQAQGDYSHAEGTYTTSSGVSSHTEGNSTSAIGNYSHAEGYYTKTQGASSHAEGNYTLAQADYSHAEGYYTSASGVSSHAEGNTTKASSPYSHTEGYKTLTLGNYSHAEGNFTTASGLASHAEGIQTTTIGSYSHTEGYKTLTEGQYSHAEGFATTASAIAAHAEGYFSQAKGYYSHAEGNTTVTNGTGSHAEGSNTKALGNYSHAEGNFTTASGIGSHAEGNLSKALGNYSHAEGYATTASGQFSHAQGQSTWALGSRAHAEGYKTTASSDFSHTEGYQTLASGSYSHAEGFYTKTIGDYSHTEGYLTTASGLYSHAEGHGSQAIGIGAHSEGYYTQASGSYTHAGGKNTISTTDYSSVIGRFNSTSSLSGQSTTDLFVIGNGADEANRSNLIEFATDGIYINTGSIPTSDPGILGKLYRTGSNSDELRVSLGS